MKTLSINKLTKYLKTLPTVPIHLQVFPTWYLDNCLGEALVMPNE